MAKPDSSPELITDVARLAAFCERQHGGWLALDTEFVREKTYHPKLCLVQVAGPAGLACIDPLALSDADLEPLRALLFDSSREKVFHAGQQDLEIFNRLWGTVPAPLFDTQLAATLLGYGDQVGYAALVETVLGVSLDKSQTRTDWSARPLNAKQLAYAADDVRHLADLYQRLHDELQQRGRLAWLADDFRQLTDSQRYLPDPQRAWSRVKGHNKLRGVKLLALQRLAAWREQRAEADDRPRRWLLADDALMGLAVQLPSNSAELARVRGLNSRLRERCGDELLAIIAAVRATPADQLPTVAPSAARLNPGQEALLDALTALVKLRAEQHRLSPTALANRRELEALVRGAAVTDGQDHHLEVLHGWRGRLVGADLQAFLAGETSLLGGDGGLRLQALASPESRG